jgi:hypothetical protein
MRKPSSIDHERYEVLTARLIEEEDEHHNDFQPRDEEESVSEWDDAQDQEDGFQNEVIGLFQTGEAMEVLHRFSKTVSPTGTDEHSPRTIGASELALVAREWAAFPE